MDCLTTIQQICDLLSENINSPLCKEIMQHLDECPKCCAQVDSVRKVVYLYKDYNQSDVPANVDHRLWRVLNLPRPESC